VLTAAITLVAFLSAAPPENRAQAEQFLRRGNEAYLAGRFDEAIRLYTSAHSLFPSPKLFYNLGQAYHAADRKQDALNAFKEFIRGMESTAFDDPDLEEKVKNARARVTALKTELERDEPQPSPAALGRPPAESGQKTPGNEMRSLAVFPPVVADRGRSRRLTWWALALGAVVTAAATIVIVSTAGHKPSCPSNVDLGCF
jgi:tetratricopeptide (TPR) repeat protein